MKDDLYQLIDGELADDETAELLHLLSVDPEKRLLFRQQMRLHDALQRNETIDPLTPAEQAAMIGRLSAAVGAGPMGSGTWMRMGKLGTLLVGLVVGTGLGYLGGEAVKGEATVKHDTIIVYRTLPATPGLGLNRDSIVSSIRDSIVQASAKAAPPKKISKPRVQRFPSNDLTGRPEASKNKKRSR